MLLQILGVLGIIVGIGLIIGAAMGSLNQQSYFAGAVFIIFGAIRFARGSNQ